MEKVLKSFKNLYSGENIGVKHWSLVSLFIIPSVLSAFRGVIDKDTPESMMVILLIAAAVVLLLAIVPGIWLLGYHIRFVEDRLMDKVGIPRVDFNMLWEGVKVIPLTLVWGIYFAIFFVVLFVIPFLPLIGTAGQSDFSGKVGAIICMLLGLVLAGIVMLAFVVLVLPFYNYIIVEYVKYGHQGYLYNPMTLGTYMKAAFRDTLIVFLKFLLVSLIVAVPLGMIYLIVVMLLMVAGIGGAAASGKLSADSVYSPTFIIAVFLVVPLYSILEMYVKTIIANAATENYIDVYRTVICPDNEDKDEVYLTHEI